MLVQNALLLALPPAQHRILIELLRGLREVYDDHAKQLFAKFPEIIHAVAEKACEDLEVVEVGVRDPGGPVERGGGAAERVYERADQEGGGAAVAAAPGAA